MIFLTLNMGISFSIIFKKEEKRKKYEICLSSLLTDLTRMGEKLRNLVLSYLFNFMGPVFIAYPF